MKGYFISLYEDVDWFLRAKAAGWEVWYVGDAVIEHHHAYSAKFRKRKAVEDFHHSMIRFYRKHYATRYSTAFKRHDLRRRPRPNALDDPLPRHSR